jgi:hypothetical protein
MTTTEPRTVLIATTLARTAPPTWSAFETLAGGDERLIVAHLRYTAMMGYHFDERTSLVVWREDVTPAG